MDMAVLDFLIGNMDRHHYETFKIFGNGIKNFKFYKNAILIKNYYFIFPNFRYISIAFRSW